MLPRLPIACLLVGLVGLPGCFDTSAPANGPTTPVILISIDTLRADHLGVYGYSRATSPNLDALAKHSTVFDRAYTNASYTLPAHMCLMTGLYPLSHGVLFADQFLADDRMTLAETLSSHGVPTAAFADKGLLRAELGFSRGFDEFVEPDRGYRGFAWSLPQVFPWLERHRDVEFFLFLHTYDVHSPYAPPEESAGSFPGPPPGFEHLDHDQSMATLHRFDGTGRWFFFERYKNLTQLVDSYDYGILGADRSIGRIVEELRRLEMYDRSWILVTSDHGESLFDNEVYVGHRWFTFESEIRVPLLIKPPSHLGNLRPRCPELTETVDLFATVLDIFGVEARQPHHGRSLLPYVLGGETPPEKETVFGFAPDTDVVYVRSKEWKFESRADSVAMDSVVKHKLGAPEGWLPWDGQFGPARIVSLAPGQLERSEDSRKDAKILGRAQNLASKWREKQKRFNEDQGFRRVPTRRLKREEIEELRRLGYAE